MLVVKLLGDSEDIPWSENLVIAMGENQAKTAEILEYFFLFCKLASGLH